MSKFDERKLRNGAMNVRRGQFLSFEAFKDLAVNYATD